MSRWLAIVGSVAVVGLVVVLAGSARQKDAPTGKENPGHPCDALIVGKPYVFCVEGEELPVEVLESPRGNWVKVRSLAGDQASLLKETWINLDRVGLIARVDWVDVPKVQGGRQGQRVPPARCAPAPACMSAAPCQPAAPASAG
jgi:hypothetical protein